MTDQATQGDKVSKARMAAVVVIDHQRHCITVDGEELLPGRFIAADPTAEVIDGFMARVDVGIFADNVLIRTDRGTKSPTAEAEAKAIVRKGLHDVLVWLGEETA